LPGVAEHKGGCKDYCRGANGAKDCLRARELAMMCCEQRAKKKEVFLSSKDEDGLLPFGRVVYV